MSWRYALPGNDKIIGRHRQLWLVSRGNHCLFAWLLREFVVWLIWLLFGAWYSLYLTLKTYGREIARLEGISISRQTITLMRLALKWCIPPRQILELGVYRNPLTALDYIYDIEIAAFQDLLNMPRTSQDTSDEKLLQDKVGLSISLRALGIPMARTIALFLRGSESMDKLILMLSEKQRLFCKARHGCKGIGSFAVWHSGGNTTGRMLNGRDLPDKLSIEKILNKLLEMDDVIIQPLLVNHESMSMLSPDGETITVRVITLRQGRNYQVLCAMMAIPVFVAPNLSRMTHLTLPVKCDNGLPQRYPAQGFLNQAGRLLAEDLYNRWPTQKSLPFWNVVLKDSIRAHGCLHHLAAVAWDWVLTVEGPVMLEGNSGWGTIMPQLICGGFLASGNILNPVTSVKQRHDYGF